MNDLVADLRALAAQLHRIGIEPAQDTGRIIDALTRAADALSPEQPPGEQP